MAKVKLALLTQQKKTCRLDKHLLCIAVKHQQWSWKKKREQHRYSLTNQIVFRDKNQSKMHFGVPKIKI
jgi:hypothetical protein